jgi:ferredoxin
VTIFYFTSTGNSLSVARQIGKFNAASKILSIPQLIQKPNLSFEDDVIGFVIPVYGFAPPKIVRRFLKKVSLKANYIFAVGTHGDRYAGFCALLKKLCNHQSLRLDYVNTLKMVDNALIGYEMEEQIRTLPEKRVEEHLRQIISDIAEQKQCIKPYEKKQRIRGVAVRAFSPIMENGAIAVKMLSVDKNCTHCGICTRVCPVGNITLAENAIVFGKKCETCLGCAHNCPKAAIHFKGEKSTARFRNSEITLNDIIQSNEQKNSPRFFQPTYWQC